MPCSCGGSNENCMHCFGSGVGGKKDRGKVRAGAKSLSDEYVNKFLKEHPLLQPNPLQPRERLNAEQRSPRTPGQQQELKSEVLADRSFVSSTGSSVRSVHLRASKRGSPLLDVTTIAKELSTARCPSCGLQFVHYIELKGHMQARCRKRKAFGITRIKCIPPKKVQQPHQVSFCKTPGEMANCSFCGCPVKTTKLQKHLGRCPKNRQRHFNSTARKKSAHTKSHQLQSTNQSAQSGHGSDAESEELNLRTRHAQVNRHDPIDATKLYGFPCSANGKFGSHPLHDGMDDESGPD